MSNDNKNQDALENNTWTQEDEFLYGPAPTKKSSLDVLVADRYRFLSSYQASNSAKVSAEAYIQAQQEELAVFPYSYPANLDIEELQERLAQKANERDLPAVTLPKHSRG